MQNEAVFIAIVIVACFVVCFVIAYRFLANPIRTLQTTTKDMQTLLEATQAALASAQTETVALRRALTSTSTQGQWGEMQLQRIVELAGMVSHCDFDSQKTLSGVNGKQQRPDLLVYLPNGRTIVVDVKAPINSFNEAHVSLDDATRVTALREYAKKVKSHVKELANKEYWRNFEPSPAWVVLLIPNEGMFRVALEYEPSLFDSGMQYNVLLASPITLLALLKAMAYGWQQENRARSAQKTIEHTHTLQRELLAFIGQWQKLHKEVGDTVTVFNLCMQTYQTNIFPAIQQICALDETTDADKYDMSRTLPLRPPKPLEDLQAFVKEE